VPGPVALRRPQLGQAPIPKRRGDARLGRPRAARGELRRAGPAARGRPGCRARARGGGGSAGGGSWGVAQAAQAAAAAASAQVVDVIWLERPVVSGFVHLMWIDAIIFLQFGAHGSALILIVFAAFAYASAVSPFTDNSVYRQTYCTTAGVITARAT